MLVLNILPRTHEEYLASNSRSVKFYTYLHPGISTIARIGNTTNSVIYFQALTAMFTLQIQFFEKLRGRLSIEISRQSGSNLIWSRSHSQFRIDPIHVSGKERVGPGDGIGFDFSRKERSGIV